MDKIKNGGKDGISEIRLAAERIRTSIERRLSEASTDKEVLEALRESNYEVRQLNKMIEHSETELHIDKDIREMLVDIEHRTERLLDILELVYSDSTIEN